MGSLRGRLVWCNPVLKLPKVSGNILTQTIRIDIARAQNEPGIGIVAKRKQQVFEGHEAVRLGAGLRLRSGKRRRQVR